MRTAVPLVVAVSMWLAGCSSVAPVPIRAGDVCAMCGQPIRDTRLAAEILPPGAAVRTFGTVSCLARYLHEQQTQVENVFVTDYGNGRLIRAQSAIFVWSEIGGGAAARDYHAFGDVPSAVAFAAKNRSRPVYWPLVLQQVAAGVTH